MKFTLLSLASLGLAATGFAQLPNTSGGSPAPSHAPINPAAARPGPPGEPASAVKQPPQFPDGQIVVPGLTEPAVTAIPDGYYLHGGVMYVLHDGRAIPLEKEISLRITPSGFVGFDDKPLNLPAGHMLTLDGRYFALPGATTTPATATGTPGSPTAAAPAATTQPVPPPIVFQPRPSNDPTSPGPDRLRPRNDPTRPGTDRERAKNDPTVAIDGERPRNDPTRPGTDRERAKNDPTRAIDGERPRNDPTRPGTDRERPKNDPTRAIDGERPRNDPTRPGTDRERANNDPTRRRDPQ
jgi:hypothetical protein